MCAPGPGQLRARLESRLSTDGSAWLTNAVERIGADPATVRTLFPAAGRRCGRGPLTEPSHDAVASNGHVSPNGRTGAEDALRDWGVDDAARTLLMVALPISGDELAEEVSALYRYGDAAEKHGVLQGLELLDAAGELGDRALPLVHDALRTNDTRLITAALAPYGARHLAAAPYRQGVLKCVFLGIPLAGIAGLAERADAELARMLTDFARERRAAGREVPVDVWRVADPNRNDEPRES